MSSLPHQFDLDEVLIASERIAPAAQPSRTKVRFLRRCVQWMAQVACMWLALHGLVQAQTKIIPTPWNESTDTFTPSWCGHKYPNSQITIPGGGGSVGDPEATFSAVLGLANRDCIGEGGMGSCARMLSWQAEGSCSARGDGTGWGGVVCGYSGTGESTFTRDGPACSGNPVISKTETRLFMRMKTCQAITDRGVYDADSRQCVCLTGVYLPAERRCSAPEGRTVTKVCKDCYGNPIYPTMGAKRQSVDLGWQPWYRHVLTYESVYRISQQRANQSFTYARFSSFGSGGMWSSSLEKTLEARAISGGYMINAARGEGLWTTLQGPSSDLRAPGTAQIDDRMVRENSGSQFTYWDTESNTIERYDAKGRLSSIFSIDGRSLAVERSDETTPAADAPHAGLPLKYRDHFGRAVTLGYELPSEYEPARIRTIVDPAGRAVHIDYAANGSPQTVTYPDGAMKRFLYEDSINPWALTGYVDEAGIRVGTYAYDANGRAVSTQKAGNVDSYQVTWDDPPIWTVVRSYENGEFWETHVLIPPTRARVTWPSGIVETLSTRGSFGVVQWTSKTRKLADGTVVGTANRQYDPRGNLIQDDDFNGSRACLSYDAVRNLVVTRVEGLGTTSSCTALTDATLPAGSRKVSTQWHPDWRLAIRTAEPGRLVTLVYNGQPDPFNGGAVAQCAPATALLPDGKPIVVLCKRVEQATSDGTGVLGFNASVDTSVAARSASWTYTAFGQVLTETDSRGVTTAANEYYADTTADHTKGDLKSSTNALGHKTSFSRYNVYGQPLEMLDANNISTVYAYDARQRLSVVTSGGVATSYDYWPTGLLKKTSQADGSAVNYEYDDAGRLKAVFDSQGNRVEYTLDASGNRTQEVAKDPSGALKRTMSRVFDALGRAQQTTGRE
jgi:YD repeat-containing protein